MTLWTPETGDWQQRGGLLVPPRWRRYERPVAIDFFAGCGGMSLGFESAGFHVAAAVEFDYWSAVTYMTNLARYGNLQIHYDTPEREAGFAAVIEKAMKDRTSEEMSVLPPRFAEVRAGTGWIQSQPADVRGCEHFWIADVRNLTGQEILDALELERGEVACVMGGPPCQGFSLAGKRNVMDPRNSLVFDYARLILEIQPKTFVMENVAGIRTMLTQDGMPVLDAFCRILADGGFGTYDALRRSLEATAGVGGAMQGRVSGEAKDDEEDEEPAPDVPPLLAMLEAK